MLHFLPPPILGPLSVTLLVLNFVFWIIPFFIIAFAKLLVPQAAWQRWCVQGLIWVASAWMSVNNALMWLLFKIEWDVYGTEGLNRKSWYLVISNHQTWLDIAVILKIFNRRIPFPRFFLKQELIWVPIVGFACWALDMPFMKRYSKEFLQKHPELRDKDLETTRKAIENFKDNPVSIFNFLEGTRFTPKKHVRQESPYHYLLRPKAGGIAYALAAMGEKFDALLDVTIIYPDDRATFWGFLSGRISRIIVRVEKMTIPQDFLGGDYMNDLIFREQLQAWVRELWRAKDTLIKQTLNGER